MVDTEETTTTAQVTDEDLMAAYVAGDTNALNELFRRYAPVIHRIMRSKYLSNEDAGDVVQETFLHLHRARKDFKQDAKLRPWLMTIAYNLMREHYRKKKRKPEVQLSDEEFRQPTEDPKLAEKLSTNELVQLALKRLPENQRDVIVLHYFEEIPFNEIAQIQGASLSAVKVRASRGYAAMREILEKMERIDGNRKKPETI